MTAANAPLKSRDASDKILRYQKIPRRAKLNRAKTWRRRKTLSPLLKYVAKYLRRAKIVPRSALRRMRGEINLRLAADLKPSP